MPVRSDNDDEDNDDRGRNWNSQPYAQGACFRQVLQTVDQTALAVSMHFSSARSYIDTIKHEAAAGQLKSQQTPWVHAPNPFSEFLGHRIHMHRGSCVGETLLRDAVRRPDVYLWAPDLMYSGVDIRCPTCERKAHFDEWCPVRIVHTMTGQHAYVAAKYKCSACKTARSRTFKRFMADCPAALKLLPEHVQFDYHIAGTRGCKGLLCDKNLADYIQALSTKLSWASIAEIINEMKATAWARRVTKPYLQLCAALDIAPTDTLATLNKEYCLQAKWVREFSLHEFAQRRDEVVGELAAGISGTALSIDWTVTAAKRCKQNYLLNIMVDNHRVLASALTASAKPMETKPLLEQMRSCGAAPRVVRRCRTAWLANVLTERDNIF